MKITMTGLKVVFNRSFFNQISVDVWLKPNVNTNLFKKKTIEYPLGARHGDSH